MVSGRAEARPDFFVRVSPGETMKKLDAQAVLRKLAEMREAMPKPTKPSKTPRKSEATSRAAGVNSLEDFDQLAIIDALESMATELDEAIQEKREHAIQSALEVYYNAEELAKDPAHAELIPHVENMRKAYEKDFGRPIPPRKQ
jgi:hypothetical protein